MTFRECLRSICGKVPGSIECTLMGFDGIAIEEWRNQPAPERFSDLFIELGTIISRIKKISTDEQIGRIEEVIVNYGTQKVLFHILTDEYFLALLISEKGNIGKARWVMRTLSREIKKELAK